jgi:RecG-like helicase
MENNAMSDLQTIPGVGPKVERLLNDVGIRSVEDMKQANPEHLYDNLCDKKAAPVDRCVLYVFRCAKYYTTHKNHDPEKLNWWNWKD